MYSFDVIVIPVGITLFAVGVSVLPKWRETEWR
jgi:hypothetical protein